MHWGQMGMMKGIFLIDVNNFNYLSKGQISQADFEETQLHLNPITEEIIKE